MTAILLLALALAMDAFAVAIVRGAAGPHNGLRAVECGLVFGVAQGVMPLIGWGLGEVFGPWIEAIDHWVAFGLLALLGARMIHQAFGGEAEAPRPPRRGAHVAGLLAAAIATSVDAAAAGLTLELFAPPVWLSCLVIGLVTALLSTGAYWFASRLGARLGCFAQVMGGIVLIALGISILVDHLG